MAFKVPLPKVLANQHKSTSCENPVGSQLNLPSFNKSDLSNLTLIGQGAFGKVFKCIKDGETYVMKQNVDVNPDSSEIRLFLKEAGLLKMLKGHENVVEIHGFSQRDNAMLLEYVSFSFGCLGIEHDVVSTLKELIDACDTMNNFSGFEHLHLYIATDVATGLHFLHSRNVAHRDLKPANVLVSNSHYAGNSDVTGYWSVRPVIAKLSDFGESRSSLLQTSTLAKTSTGRLNRGSPAYMAPEAFDGSDFKAHVQNLFAMDVWSFAMTLFQLLNPNIRHPYAVEMDTKPNDMDCLDMLKQLHRIKALPRNDCKYSQFQKSVWLPLQNVYNRCAQYSTVDRPLAKDIVQMLVNEYVEIHRLVVYPPVIVVDHEVRVRCQSEKITLHDSAYFMLNLLKDQHTTYDAYNVVQSPQVSASHDIIFPLVSASPKTAAEAKLELCLCSSAVLADDSFHCAIYTLLPYSFFMCKDNKGKAVFVHLPIDVTTSAGLNTSPAVRPLQEDMTVPAISNWLFNKMDLSCDVCYKLAVLKPVKQTSLEKSACNVIAETNLHMECSNTSSPVSSLGKDNSDGEQDCGSSGILPNRVNNRWGTSENSIANWQSCAEELIENLPHNINGLRKCRLRCNAKRKDEVMKITKDGRP
jgi:serine/threonine protein kinase